MFHHLAQLLSQFCQFPISPGRNRQRVEQPKSRSTQPMFAKRCVTLYHQALFIENNTFLANETYIFAHLAYLPLQVEICALINYLVDVCLVRVKHTSYL